MPTRICPYGHPLTRGRYLQGWSPCTCASAWQHHGGHRTYQCLACVEYAITSVQYVPEHLGGGHPGRRSAPDRPGRGGPSHGEL